MKNRLIIACIFCFAIVWVNCSSERTLMPFRVQEASYQSWFINADERGTEIWVKLRRVPADLVFDSLVFRGVQLPVVRTNHRNFVLLQATIPSEQLQSLRPLPLTSLSNRLQYTDRGERKSFLLNNIKRKEMKYF